MQRRRLDGFASAGPAEYMPRHAAPPRFTPAGRAHWRASGSAASPRFRGAAWRTHAFLLLLGADRLQPVRIARPDLRTESQMKPAPSQRTATFTSASL